MNSVWKRWCKSVSPRRLGLAIGTFVVPLASCGARVAVDTERLNRDSRILFVKMENRQHDIYSIAPDGSDLRNLTDSPRSELLARWSPDGRNIVYQASGRIHIMNHDGSAKKALVAGKCPVFMADGKRILFSRGKARTTEVPNPPPATIYSMNVDGSDVRRENSAGRRRLSISPDGKRVAVWSYVNTDTRIRDATAADPALVYTEHISGDRTSQARWSPDGSRVVFQKKRFHKPGYHLIRLLPVNWEIYTLERTGKKMKNLTKTNKLSERNPTWSPDGKMVAFQTSTKGGYSIDVVRVDGRKRRSVIKAPGINLQPRWSPYIVRDGQ